jgi:predicted RNA binding protein YcfA (HicA-like mRNA interferase family)
MAQLAVQNGWTLARITGSHHIFTKAGREERLVIPFMAIDPSSLAFSAH